VTKRTRASKRERIILFLIEIKCLSNVGGVTRAMAMATTWAMATATRVAGDGEGENDGGNSNRGGNEGERR
jgi:hypothetical protein